MADFIGRATQLLNHEVPGFLEMDHVLGPPINFRDAMMRAQQGTLADIVRRARRAPPLALTQAGGRGQDRLMSRVGIGAIVRVRRTRRGCG